MLVLSRKAGERIAIGGHGEILVTVLRIRGGKILLGIDAAPSIPVQRVVSGPEVVMRENGSPGEQNHVVELAY